MGWFLPGASPKMALEEELRPEKFSRVTIFTVVEILCKCSRAVAFAKRVAEEPVFIKLT